MIFIGDCERYETPFDLFERDARVSTLARVGVNPGM
jgi:hypothetical protein